MELNKEKQIEEMACKKCLHYEGCLNRFREAKKNGQHELTDEQEYFAYAKDCDMYITGYRKASEVAREIVELIEAVREEFSPTEYHRGYNDALDDFKKAIEKKYTQNKCRDKISEFGKYSPLSWRNTEDEG